MIDLRRVIFGAAALLSVACEAGADSPAAPPPIPGWDAFASGLQDLPTKVLEKLPERVRNDPQIRQEVGRLMLEAIAVSSMNAVWSDPDHPMFLPLSNVVLNIFQPNADTVYRATDIKAGGAYRLRGRKGSVRIANIGAFPAPDADGHLRASQYYDINALHADANGDFDVLLSPVKPQAYAGDWWQLDPGAVRLLLRAVSSDWSKERDPTISIERVDAPAPRPRPPAAEIERRLQKVSESTLGEALLLVNHVEQLRAEGYVNTKMKVWDVTANYGGIFGQFYYEAVYDLKDDEALVIETDYPKGCAYASLLLTDEIFETTDWYNNESSLNDAQWHVDSDNKLRVVVSAKDPGVKNWLDVAGYPTGVVQGRWMQCGATPVPSVRKVMLADVRKTLPSETALVTPAERDRIIRDRRAAFQQRLLW